MGSREHRLAEDLLTMALVLCLWLVCGSYVMALVGDLASHPLRRVLIGAGLVLLAACALWQRRRVSAAYRDRPWLVLPLAAALLGAAAVDGLLGSPYVVITQTSVGLAVIVARARTVWACVALLDVCYAAIVFNVSSPTQLSREGQLDGVVGALLGPPFVALALLGLTRLFVRFLLDVEAMLDRLRRGDPALTPALTRAVLSAGRAPLALPAPKPTLLTPAERRVVDGLTRGRAPKELAHEWGLSLATVRTHIKRAKRKAGARTISELVAKVSRGD